MKKKESLVRIVVSIPRTDREEIQKEADKKEVSFAFIVRERIKKGR